MQSFLLILLLGVSVGWLASRIGQPAAVAQVLLGLVIGPPLLGWVDTGEALELIGQLGVVLLLGMAGMHIGSRHLAKHGLTALWVAMFGIVFCLAVGYVFAVMWGSPHAEAIYVGTALTATSIGISVQVLHQLRLFDHRVGEIVIAAAVIDDVIALYLLATAHGILSEEMAGYQIGFSVLETALILGAIYALCRWLSRRIAPILTGDRYNTGLLLVSVVIVAFGWVTETRGYSMVVGGFFAGLGLGDGMNPSQRKQMSRQLSKIVPFLVPFFFVVIGSRAEWGVLADPGMPTLLIGLLIIAMAGKVLGGYLGALRATGNGQSLLIGMSMAPRGEVALVIAGLGFFQGHISHHVLIVLILVTIVTAAVSPLVMARLAKRVS
ncbi:MAG TPA: cation:proton antiporter [Chromatiales bacterium]|nr:cation:proton antiporter [Thiotrichales bacterium]HIP69023.1 cation:proton antiporter [Chromatiales bacterium]